MAQTANPIFPYLWKEYGVKTRLKPFFPYLWKKYGVKTRLKPCKTIDSWSFSDDITGDITICVLIEDPDGFQFQTNHTFPLSSFFSDEETEGGEPEG